MSIIAAKAADTKERNKKLKKQKAADQKQRLFGI
jgi:hypothetical protein